MKKNYRELWDSLISSLCREMLKIEKQGDKSVEDIWIQGTIQRVLTEMCELHRLPPNMHKLKELTRPMFED